MPSFSEILDYFLHLDNHLAELTSQYGPAIYLILFLIVFCETGLVVAPFLPGDSLLFAAGLIAAEETSGMNVWLVSLTFVTAALLGDNANYFFGKYLGPKVFKSDTSRFFKKKHLERTSEFFQRYGSKTIIIARFVPIVRTFTPFVAGMGAMPYRQFIGYSFFAALLWVGVCVFAGYFFGNIPAVKENFALAILGLIAVSVLPPFVEIMRHKMKEKKQQKKALAEASTD